MPLSIDIFEINDPFPAMWLNPEYQGTISRVTVAEISAEQVMIAEGGNLQVRGRRIQGIAINDFNTALNLLLST